MQSIDGALGLVRDLLLGLLGFVLAIFTGIEAWASSILVNAGLPRATVNFALIALAVLLFVAAVRLFGGLIRVLLVIFLALLLVHLLVAAFPLPH